jgi:CheY-like chemotaxis protein
VTPVRSHAADRSGVSIPRIALFARDRRFVRVTSFLLSRHGYAVATANSPAALVDLLEGPDADVVVVDASDSSNGAAPTAALLATLPRRRGLVVIGDAAGPQALHAPTALSKWSPIERLLDEIERAHRRSQGFDWAPSRV